ncbi:hypothetical protein G9F72_010265 [Clostridium estertheticum]|uniref:hypothetical protein n=1 Tax=Clostridium estertheticum TaxID=238834 RepID=UPI001CD16083|nr:hypothetical protein [Clostridium estertheticum]MBZ9686708.1 hypothetical protein [Clostridium estertheticum]
MKTYLEDPMQDMWKMGGMYGMPHMKDMQSMYPMMGGMNEMKQMMDMQIMYQMMQSMCHMMHSMHHLMIMQSMYPMMCMDEASQMKPMYMQDDKRQFPIPMLVNLEQLSPNQIQISYDRDVDMSLGMKPTNYWIQDTMNAIPQGIATLGKNDKVNAGNSLTASKVRIASKNGSAKTFILTFNRQIPRGAEYMLIICYVTVKGAPPYSGDNGMATFIGK